jgi:hypothetical protein
MQKREGLLNNLGEDATSSTHASAYLYHGDVAH